MDYMQILTPVIYAALTVLATILGIIIKKVGNQLVDWVKAKVGETTFNQALEVATGIYIYLEEKYKDSLEKMGETKRLEMEEMLLEKFPTLTAIELESINKRIWAGFQEGFNR